MMEQWSLDSLLASLDTIEPDVLLMAGTSDLAVSPRTSQSVAKRLPHGKYREYPGAGHLLHEEKPEQISEDVLEFLDGCQVS